MVSRYRKFEVHDLAWAACLIMALGHLGCSAGRYRPVETNELDPSEDPALRRPVGEEQALAIRQILGELTADFASSRPPSTGSARGRWADVAEATDWAVADAEMAILAQSQADGIWTFELLTLDDRPASLTVRRLPHPQVWEAEATVGLFPQREANLAHARRLLAALEDRMAQLSGLVRFDTEDPPSR